MLIGILYWIYRPDVEEGRERARLERNALASETPSADADEETFPRPLNGTPSAEDPRLLDLPNGRLAFRDGVTMSRQLHTENQHPEADLQLIDQILAVYRLVYKANPVGSENAEIMTALLGENERGHVFFDTNHPSLAPDGTLLDRWGNAYFFHPLARDRMDVRTAGPDGKLWTADDVALGLEEEASDGLQDLR